MLPPLTFWMMRRSVAGRTNGRKNVTESKGDRRNE